MSFSSTNVASRTYPYNSFFFSSRSQPKVDFVLNFE
nr:MAG TPA: hypothetical protein [Caudoviricetes sp.]